MTGKTAIVLFNLGGPDSPSAVKPFLYNLFNDPAIIRLPAIIRKPLAHLISKKRAKTAMVIYEHLGGKSPLLEETNAQAEALHKALPVTEEHKIFICMRYWHPMSAEIAKKIVGYRPERIIFLPLYPQFSSTTTASSFADLEKKLRKKTNAKIEKICCYPIEPSFIAAQAELLKSAIDKHAKDDIRILFSAHGLPEKIIAAGDPYQWQVEQTAKSILAALGNPALESTVCYQSRVGPLKWIGPSTEEEIHRAGKDGKGIILLPIAFVSEHSETLVELDIEYKLLAEKSGVRHYTRVPTLRTHPGFIRALADLCATASGSCSRICPNRFSCCPQPC